jgi:transcriptional regulator with GAF, ATPase, and Fis domain
MTKKNYHPEVDQKNQDIIVSFFCTPSPISIDTICTLSSASPQSVLNVLDSLKKKQLIYQKKGFPKHSYFVNGIELANHLQRHMDTEKFQTVLRIIIPSCSQSFARGDEKTLLLAELYRKLGDVVSGLPYFNKAAKILLKSGDRDGAISHYDYLLKHLKDNTELLNANASYLVDACLGKISVMRHTMTFEEQTSLLVCAQRMAKQHKLWDRLAHATLLLGEMYMRAAEHSKTFQCISDFHRISKQVGDQNMHRMCTYLKCEVLTIYGRISEVIHHYDEIVESLEQFGDDEIALRAVGNVGMCYVFNGRFARGMGLIDAVRAKACLLNFPQLAIFADILAVLCLLELRKTEEAGSRLGRISSIPDEAIPPIGLRAVERFKAFLHLLKKEYVEADECLKKSIEHSRSTGRGGIKTPWIFELLGALEDQGFFHEEMNYDGEAERMIAGRDIHMKGAAYRYRALRNLERQGSFASIMNDLRQSEKYLKKAGAEFELARTRVDLGRVYLQTKHSKRARSYLTSAWAIFSKVDNALFPKDLLACMPKEHKLEFMIDRIIRSNMTLGSAKSLPAFLEQMIDAAIDSSLATRGAFFLRQGEGKPVLIASRNLDPMLYKGAQNRFIEQIVAHTALEGADIVIPGQSAGSPIQQASMIKAGITSQVCMPVKLDQHIHGFLYVDNSLNSDHFSNDVLAYLRLLCSQMAVGISNIKEREDISGLRDHYKQEVTFYKREMGIATPIGSIIGNSEGIKRVVSQIQRVAPTPTVVLIGGETGVGKELVAKAVHSLSDRNGGSFIPVNLATFPPDLVTSELFGHEKGAFTGANDQYRGRFELANGGTLFLDEIGDLPLNVQVKLLRVLDEGIFERLGGSHPISSNARIVAASNKELLHEIEKGVFREDLFYRLNAFPIYIPPLRDRKEDILPLAHHFINKFSKQMRKSVGRISKEEMNKLLSYHWPGNVRELEHVIERAMILSDGPEISFPGLKPTSNEALFSENPQSMSLADVERSHIEKVLTMTHWRVNGPKGAASLLGLKPSTLFFRIKKLGIKKLQPF